MTTSDDEQPEPGQTPEGGARALHVVEGYAGFHLVTQETLDAARAAQDAADAAPYYEDFGDLRRSGDLEMLAERLENWDLSLNDYVAAIEQAAGRTPTSQDLGERLAGVHAIGHDREHRGRACDTPLQGSPQIMLAQRAQQIVQPAGVELGGQQALVVVPDLK